MHGFVDEFHHLNVFMSSATAALRDLKLMTKYDELKESGQLDSFLTKRRKRNAAKDRRRLPRRQQRTE